MRGNAINVGMTAGSKRQVTLSADARARHLYVAGGTGVGKSKFLEHCIREDILHVISAILPVLAALNLFAFALVVRQAHGFWPPPRPITSAPDVHNMPWQVVFFFAGGVLLLAAFASPILLVIANVARINIRRGDEYRRTAMVANCTYAILVIVALVFH